MKVFDHAIQLSFLALIVALSSCGKESYSGVDTVFINARAYTLPCWLM